jgi:hypothetical protein
LRVPLSRKPLDCLAYYFFPDHARIVALASMLPQAAGEGGLIGWLLIKGVRTERVEAS